MDIYELENGNLSLRRLWNIVRRLPVDSEVAAEHQHLSDEQRFWLTPQRATFLLADLFDAVRAAGHQITAVQLDDRGRRALKAPKPYPRPSFGEATDRPARARSGAERRAAWAGRVRYTPK